MLAPVWNAVKDFVELRQRGSVTLHFDESGKLTLIESRRTIKP